MTNEGFFFGFTYPFKCIKFFFSHPKIITYSITPIIINLLIYGSIFIFSYAWVIGTIGQLTGVSQLDAGFWTELLHIILLIAGFLLLLITCYLAFVILGGIITAPFNEKISQMVEEIVTNEKVMSDLGFWKDAYISIKAEIEKLVFYFSFLFIFFLINFIPIIGTIVSVSLGTVFSFLYNALDFLDYPMTRKLIPFKQKLRVTRKGGMLTYGFGCIAFLMMFLPIVNVFMKPILVAAGTSLFFEKGYNIIL
ncbi:MAG: EI24 domain-containing protein [Ignavibacteria bacterium]